MILGLIMRCTDKGASFNVINTNGLLIEGESYSQMIFVNENEGYLFGERHGEAVWKMDGEASRVDTAIVYFTNDGGVTWEGQVLGDGIITNAHRSGNDVYTIRLQRTNGNYNSTVYKLNKSANKWEKITEIDLYVRDGDFSDSNAWVITKKEINGEFKIYVSYDKGVIWKAIVDRFVFQPVIDTTLISFLDSDKSNSGIYDALITFDRADGTIHKDVLPFSFEATLLRKYDRSLFIAGVEGESLCIYKRAKGGKFDLIYKLSLGEGRTFPKELRVYDNQLMLLAGVREGLHIQNHFITSVDGGKNWLDEKLYRPSYASPLSSIWDIESGLKIWIYSGSGKIQILKKSAQ
jgi:hypothetical protein